MSKALTIKINTSWKIDVNGHSQEVKNNLCILTWHFHIHNARPIRSSQCKASEVPLNPMHKNCLMLFYTKSKLIVAHTHSVPSKGKVINYLYCYTLWEAEFIFLCCTEIMLCRGFHLQYQNWTLGFYHTSASGFVCLSIPLSHNVKITGYKGTSFPQDYSQAFSFSYTKYGMNNVIESKRHRKAVS